MTSPVYPEWGKRPLPGYSTNTETWRRFWRPLRVSKASWAKRLQQHQALARLSRQLTQLKCDVPLGIETWSELRCPQVD